MKQNRHRFAFSLLEMIAVIAILGLVAAVIVPRVAGSNEVADIAACHAYKGDIEIQAEIWKHNSLTDSWPAADLSDIEANTGYFPEGLPICPVDGAVNPYTIDAATGLVIGHSH